MSYLSSAPISAALDGAESGGGAVSRVPLQEIRLEACLARGDILKQWVTPIDPKVTTTPPLKGASAMLYGNDLPLAADTSDHDVGPTI